ncbi:hypothetical protein Slin15195_G102520 [Septoria linicola]|uniref:Uncharacterized protein n=1 Tax=Septoria linicola TaxID=215465 RepID=A0A9Q9B108_9PEZI|nr:hypothetical protein Slin14017_G065520 [Septoria linicola]USW56933.1 hypothetical protein Slin15195_G102520 [Septoria linicola]
MPAFSYFPEAGNSKREVVEAPRPRDPNRHIADFKDMLEQVRQWKQEELDKLEAKTMVILNAHGQLMDEHYAELERLEGDVEAVKERHRKLGKLSATYDTTARKWEMTPVIDEETKTWSMKDWKMLVAELEVSDGFVSGRKTTEDSEQVGNTGELAKEKHNGGVTENGPAQYQRRQRVENGRMFDADRIYGGHKGTEQTEQDVDDGEDELRKNGDQNDDATDSESSVASSYARRLAKKTKTEMKKRVTFSDDTIEVRRQETPDVEACSHDSLAQLKSSRQPEKVKSKSVKRKATKASSTMQQTQDSGLETLQTSKQNDPPLIPDSWRTPGAWSNELTSGIKMEETEEENLAKDLTALPEYGESELPPSPQGSLNTSESSDNLFVGPYKEKRAHAKPFRSTAPSPPPRKTPSSDASSDFMRELFETNSDSMILPGSERGSAEPGSGPEDRNRREAAFLTARPNTKEVLLLGEQGIEAPLPKKRAADAEVDGALGAFVSTKPMKKKAKKEGGEVVGGEKSPAPVRWPGQAQPTTKDVSKGNKSRR